MEDKNFNFDFTFLKTSFWVTIFLGILKIANVLQISNFYVFLPLMIGLGGVFFIVFLVGLITLHYMSKIDPKDLEDNKDEDKNDSENEEDA